jgi:Glycosyltransferase like family
MISWIVATHDREILQANLLGTLEPEIDGDDEIIIVQDAPSIAVAYNRGATIATRPVRCYVHHDVRVLDAGRLRAGLLEACTARVGMVGVIGSTDAVLPWWDGHGCGSVIDARAGLLKFGPGGQRCAYLDGLLLATAQQVTWDESYPGWHGYDHDVCQQMLARGLTNWCLEDGGGLVAHNTGGPTDLRRVDGWAVASARFDEKWGRR